MSSSVRRRTAGNASYLSSSSEHQQLQREDEEEEEFLSPVTLQFASPTDSIPSSPPKYNNNNKYNPYYHRTSRYTSSSESSWPHKVLFAGGIVLAVLPWLSHLLTVYQGHSLQRTIDQVTTEYRMLQPQFIARKKGLHTAMAETDQLQSSNDALLAQLQRAGDTFVDFNNAVYQESEQIEKGLLQRINDVEQEISRASERNLMERGHLFHRNTVEMRIVGMNGIDKHLVMELASTTLVPHVVDTFISLVLARHYDGWSLLHRGLVNEETLEAVRRDVQQPMGLSVVAGHNSDMHNQLALLQHSDEQSNIKYSVVFKDHGPYFYINMSDSADFSHNHNDVVIGTVVQGREILDFMVQNHIFLAIETMELLSVNPMTEAQQMKNSRAAANSSSSSVSAAAATASLNTSTLTK
jgi:hypothetical protein